jgi:hypothetical protein
MSAIRWIACVPVAMFVSLLTWALVKKLFPSAHYGGGFVASAFGLFPLVLAGTLPTATFIITGSLTSPSRGRVVTFVFFGLSFCLSCGGLDMISSQSFPVAAFWLTSSLGILSGAAIGLIVTLHLQARRPQAPNQPPQPTP